MCCRFNMKQKVMKIVALLFATSSTIATLGCASAPDATANAPLAKEDRCVVTGSNLPRRDCRDLVDVLPGDSVDRPTGAAPSRSGGTPR
jgi:hypothetical protein